MALHHEIHRITDTDEHARDFLFQRGLLKTSLPCPSCSANMTFVAWYAFKSLDLFIWCCSKTYEWTRNHRGVVCNCKLWTVVCKLQTIVCRQLSADSVGLLGWCPRLQYYWWIDNFCKNPIILFQRPVISSWQIIDKNEWKKLMDTSCLMFCFYPLNKRSTISYVSNAWDAPCWRYNFEHYY